MAVCVQLLRCSGLREFLRDYSVNLSVIAAAVNFSLESKQQNYLHATQSHLTDVPNVTAYLLRTSVPITHCVALFSDPMLQITAVAAGSLTVLRLYILLNTQIGHFRYVLPRQSRRLTLKKLNLTQHQTACADFPPGVAAPRGPLPTKPRTNRRQCALPSSRHPQRPNNGLICCCLLRSAQLRRTPYCALSIGMTQQFFVFCPGDLHL